MPLPFRLIASLGFSIQLSLACAAGSVGGFESWTLDRDTSKFATFQSHNTKVLGVGGSGAIVSRQTYLRQSNINDFAVSYVDFETRRAGVLLAGTAATNAPCLAQGADNEVAVFVNDYLADRVLFKLLRVDPVAGSAEAVVESEFRSGMFGKYACASAAPDFLFIGNDGVLVRIGRDGSVKRRLTLFEHTDKEGRALQYPQLVAEDGALLVAMTTVDKPRTSGAGANYWSILFLHSADEGRTWRDRSGRTRTPPVPIDYDPSLAITPPNSGTDNVWLLGLDVVNGMVVADYSASRQDGKPNPHGGLWPVMMAWQLVAGAGQDLELARLPADFLSERQSGFFVEDPRNIADVYFVTFEGMSLVVLKSRDRGESWRVAGRFAGPFACPYAIDGTRQITADRMILGVYTERGDGCVASDSAHSNAARTMAFRLRVVD